ncbi:hypothetical protein [Paraburkholderia graminis]|uniref:hypothetical protein n=1 Tax=Paraburkholderia graminis TaxID=60548 RepID=UPI0038BCE089
MNRGREPAVLMVSMEPPASLEEEFNDWYDTEHFPQRRALPGFSGASRWICMDGWPRWLALYDLASADALDTDAYRAVSGSNSTPWSKRLLPRTVGRSRVVGEALDTAQAALQYDPLSTCRLLVFSVRTQPDADDAKALASEISGKLGMRDDLRQLRWFTGDDGMLWTLAAFDTPVNAVALAALVGRPRGRGVASFNLYAPYRRSTY